MNMTKYKDPRWQKKRLEIMERDNFACQICGETESTLNVHHKYYEDNCDPWEYDDQALVTLCEECHKYEKEESQYIIECLTKAFKRQFYMADINDLAGCIYSLKLNYDSSHFAAALEHFFKSDGFQEYIVNKYNKYLREK